MSDSTHIVCPDCSAVNRLPAARMTENPKCGRCGQALFRGLPVELTAGDFYKQISRNDIPLLVDFWAPWCGPCKMMAPQFEQAARQLEPRVRLAKVNTEAQPDLGARLGIRSIPTMVMFRDGRELARHSGAIGADEIVRWALSTIG